MKKIGKVTSIKNGLISVYIEECSDCKGCTACSGSSSKIKTVTFKSNVPLAPGDIISFELPDSVLLKISILIYIVPILFFFAGYIIGNHFFKSEGVKIICSFSALFISFIIIYIYDRIKGKDFAPKNITKISN